jgi:hypothetical protein
MLKRKAAMDMRLTEIIESDAFYTLASYSDYGKWVLRWLGLLGQDRVLIEYLPNISRRPYDVLQKVCNFMGIPFHPGFFSEANSKIFANEVHALDHREAIELAQQRAADLVDEFAQRLPDIALGLRTAHLRSVAGVGAE